MIKAKSLLEEMPEFRNDYLHLIIDEAARLIYAEWIRKPSCEEYQEAARIFERQLRNKQIEFWIQDAHCLGEMALEDQKMVLQELVPVAVSSNLKKLALVTSDEKNMSAFMQLANDSDFQLNAAIKIQNFMTYREAVDWISS